jgi:hypothetical protein|tara:strand:+ start:312 stop:800 length:489 start_codon:yes stop_codon:yes gene_type:complete
MASIQNHIRAALESKLAATSGIPSGIAFENIPFSPTTGTSYFQTNYLPTLRRPAVRGLNPQQRYDGVFVITAYTPEGYGPKAADDYSDLIATAFEATTHIYYSHSEDRLLTEAEAFITLEDGGRILVDNAIDVSIDYAERQQGFLDAPWYYVPTNIGWYVYN